MTALAIVLMLLLAGGTAVGQAPAPSSGLALRLLPRPLEPGLLAEGPRAPRLPSDPGPIPLRLRPRYQDRAAPGGVARVETPTGAEAVLVRLVDSRHHVVSRGASFKLADRWVSLLGVPPTAAPGAWTLSVGVADHGVLRWGSAPFLVTARTFAAETIPLTRELTDIRVAPDPKKDREAVDFARILAAVDPADLWDPGPFSFPTDATRRSSGYGDRRVYAYDDGTTGQAVHAGLDLAVAEGSLVTACGRGRVVFAGTRITTGGTVAVEHLPGVFSLYYHMSEILVKVGQVLEKGQLLGAAGMTGLATGPHLHWEVQVRGVAVDPDLSVRQALVPPGMQLRP